MEMTLEAMSSASGSSAPGTAIESGAVPTPAARRRGTPCSVSRRRRRSPQSPRAPRAACSSRARRCASSPPPAPGRRRACPRLLASRRARPPSLPRRRGAVASRTTAASVSLRSPNARRRIEIAVADEVDVARHAHHAVRIQAAQVRPHQHIGHLARARAATCRAAREGRATQRGELRRRDGTTSLSSAPEIAARASRAPGPRRSCCPR